MVKPRLIIVIRHAQSEGNKNREIHQTIPDHRVKLTQDGWAQAYEAGHRLRKMLRPDDTLHFFTSPYRRTRETAEGILHTLTGDDPEPSPFKRSSIKVYEEPRLREQDFGNFQPCSAEMERMWQERADYGHFFYRIPNGESAADAYDRISGFNESLWRQFGEDDFASVCVLVTHGLMSRVFLMKWYHFSIEYFEDLRNINHCEFLVMRKNEDSGKYILENKLRTWSELRDEKKKRDKERVERGEIIKKLERVASAPVVRRWGGCPNGCNHGQNFKIRSEVAELVRISDQLSEKASRVDIISTTTATTSDSTRCMAECASSVSTSNDSDIAEATASTTPALEVEFATPVTTIIPATPAENSTTPEPRIVVRRPIHKRFQSFISDAGQENGDTDADVDNSELDDPRQRLVHGPPHIDVIRAREEIVSSPDGTPSFISPEHRMSSLKSPPAANGIVLSTTTIADALDEMILSKGSGDLPALHLHMGRDFGGTYSGHASQAGSSDEDHGDHSGKRSHGSGNLGVTGSAVKHVRSLGVTKMKQHAAERQTEDSSSEESGMARGAKACRLGDVPHSCSDIEADADDEGDDELSKEEKFDKSIRGSVY